MTEKNKAKEKNREKALKPPSSFHMEADRSRGGMAIVLSGVVGISDFSDDFILLKSHGGRIEVKGKNLFICVYENNAVEIQGKVSGVEFKYGRN